MSKPKLPKEKRKVKICITLSPKILDLAKKESERDKSPLSQTLEYLIKLGMSEDGIG